MTEYLILGAQRHVSMTGYLRLGGPLLLLIMLLGVAAVCAFLARRAQLITDRTDTTDFLAGIFNLLRKGNAAEAMNQCEITPGPVARLAAVAIRRRGESAEVLGKELADAADAAGAMLARRTFLLTLVARVAPLLGLLGTVLGILRALTDYRQNGIMHSGDIADALTFGALTSAAGLVVAIISYTGREFIRARIERLEMDMREASAELLHGIEDAAKS